ncbi:hypothetical protein CVT25_012271 [Psilocybe cyanescens]|uniref:Uncharacterized protein n=1 Tax=Psilocybe cyanescens TaxID=93625 RepID=A0A409XH67_PSICY|nr:hypothetical protein CVT25_012271 [Psilocybe cyanescens]
MIDDDGDGSDICPVCDGKCTCHPQATAVHKQHQDTQNIVDIKFEADVSRFADTATSATNSSSKSLLRTGLLQHRNGSGSALDNTSSSLDYSPSVSSSSSSSYAPRAQHKRPQNGPVFRKLASTPASDEPRFAPVPHHQFDPSLDTRNEVALPPGARKMTELVGHDPLLPILYELDQHPLVNHPCAHIILGVADWSWEAMAARFCHSANTKVPRNKEDGIQQGIFYAKPTENIFYLERNKYGSGQFEDDILKSWALSREDRNQDDLDKCHKLQEDILGPTSLMSPHKPVKDENGNYIGGIQFERHN